MYFDKLVGYVTEGRIVMGHINRNLNIICCVYGFIFIYAIGSQASTLPPDPNNAALLYYQAFLCQPETNYAEEQLVYNNRPEKIYDLLCGGELEFDPNIDKKIQELEKRLKNDSNEPNEIPPEIQEMMPEGFFESGIQFRLSELRERREHERKMRGIDPNRTIRNYMKKCRDSIELVQAASELSYCDWGIRYSQGKDQCVISPVKIRSFAFMLRVDALLFAANGDYRKAFESCMMMRRFDRHLGDDTDIHYVMSTTIIDRTALYNTKILLGSHRPKVETLKWLKNQLATQEDSPLFLTKMLKMDFELTLQSLRNNNNILDNALEAMNLKDQIRSSFRNKNASTDMEDRKVQSITDEELVALAGEPYESFLNSALQVINSGMSYKEKMSKIDILTKKIRNEFGGDPASYPIIAAHPEKLLTLYIVNHSDEVVASLYRLHVDHVALINVLMTGIEVYLTEAETGQLPEKLPEGVPKDPFTGRDFAYEITEEGFTLSLPDKNIPEQRQRPYEFKVPK